MIVSSSDRWGCTVMAGRIHSITIPSRPDALRVMRAYFRPLLEDWFEEETARHVLLAIDECCSNMLRHRCATLDGGSLTVASSLEGDRVRFRFDSFCRAEDVAEIAPRDLQDVRPGGLGTHFVAQVMDTVRYEEDPANPAVRHLHLEKTLDKEGGPDDGSRVRDRNPA